MMHDSRMFVGHKDRKKTISYNAKNGGLRGKSWTRQTVSDAFESTIKEDLFGNPFHTVITKSRLTKKFITDEKGAGLLLPRMLLQRLSAEDSTFCLQILKLRDTLEVVWDARCLLRREKQQSHVINACCHATRSIFQVIRER